MIYILNKYNNKQTEEQSKKERTSEKIAGIQTYNDDKLTYICSHNTKCSKHRKGRQAGG